MGCWERVGVQSPHHHPLAIPPGAPAPFPWAPTDPADDLASGYNPRDPEPNAVEGNTKAVVRCGMGRGMALMGWVWLGENWGVGNLSKPV